MLEVTGLWIAGAAVFCLTLDHLAVAFALFGCATVVLHYA